MSKESDLNELRGQALGAYQGGRSAFVARFKSGTWGTKAGEMVDWEDNLAAVESVGWVLVHWDVTVDYGGSYSAIPVFRRRDALPEGLDTRGAPPQDVR